ncbi:class F sortase [Kitasatospora sp. NPDC050463]|uniref:class F sortase n=1 Tax=Kitasatospora sp. NPDC050463 TaxID=3155786 RepID=UPI0033C24875
MPSPDRRHRRAPRRGPGRLTAGAVAVAVVAGAWLVRDGSANSDGPPLPPAPAAAPVPSPAPGTAPGGATPSPVPSRPAPAPLPASVPTRIRIPSVKVDAPVVGLGLDSAQHLATPPMNQHNLVGWYRDGATPGAPGNAIAVGHADDRTGPAVFYRLGLLRAGDTVEVVRKDRRTAVFTVDQVRVFAKKEFPDALVYGATDRPELRVITCGGRFDQRTGYESNTVVFAHLSSVR